MQRNQPASDEPRHTPWLLEPHPSPPRSLPPQGPTISTVYHFNEDGTQAQHGFYAATICVHKKQLFAAVKTLQKVRSLARVPHQTIACQSPAPYGPCGLLPSPIRWLIGCSHCLHLL